MAKAKAKKSPAKKAAKPAAKLASKPAAKKAAVKTKTKAAAKPTKASKAPAAKSVLKVSAKASLKAEAPKMVKMVKSSAGMKRFSPLDDRILIERVVAPEKTAGGLFIPDSAQEKPTVGKVVAVGRGHRDAKGRTRPCDVKVGDAVLFTAWSGAEIEVDGQKYVIMRETDLLGVTTA